MRTYESRDRMICRLMWMRKAIGLKYGKKKEEEYRDDKALCVQENER